MDSGQKSWVIDDRCIVNCDDVWHRAVISEILPNDLFIKVNINSFISMELIIMYDKDI